MSENMWWGYRHVSGAVQAKQFFDDRAPIQDAQQSGFVAKLVEPFRADSRDEALKIVRRLTTQTERELVAGNVMERSLHEFVRDCCMHIQIEQRQPTPDTVLISVLSDAVRLARESDVHVRRIVAELTVIDGA